MYTQVLHEDFPFSKKHEVKSLVKTNKFKTKKDHYSPLIVPTLSAANTYSVGGFLLILY